MKITDVRMFCPVCQWQGQIINCEPDIDGDGSLGCPRCHNEVQAFPDQRFKDN